MGEARQHAELARTALRRFIELDAAQSPLVLVLDDMQLADPETLTLVEELTAGLGGSPVVLLTAARPEMLVKAGGWGETIREDMPNIGKRWLSLCDTPDLDVVSARFPTVRNAIFRAGVELGLFHLGLWLLSLAVRAGWVQSLKPFARLFHDSDLTVDVGGQRRRGSRHSGNRHIPAIGTSRENLNRSVREML